VARIVVHPHARYLNDLSLLNDQSLLNDLSILNDLSLVNDLPRSPHLRLSHAFGWAPQRLLVTPISPLAATMCVFIEITITVTHTQTKQHGVTKIDCRQRTCEHSDAHNSGS